MSRIVESLYTISGINLQESNLDKSNAIVGKISNIIEKYLPDYDVIYTDNTITVSNGKNVETFTVKATQETKYTLVSPIYGEDTVSSKQLYTPGQFANVCAGIIIDYLKDEIDDGDLI